jgi:trehalose utilization protein
MFSKSDVLYWSEHADFKALEPVHVNHVKKQALEMM